MSSANHQRTVLPRSLLTNVAYFALSDQEVLQDFARRISYQNDIDCLMQDTFSRPDTSSVFGVNAPLSGGQLPLRFPGLTEIESEAADQRLRLLLSTSHEADRMRGIAKTYGLEKDFYTPQSCLADSSVQRGVPQSAMADPGIPAQRLYVGGPTIAEVIVSPVCCRTNIETTEHELEIAITTLISQDNLALSELVGNYTSLMVNHLQDSTVFEPQIKQWLGALDLGTKPDSMNMKHLPRTALLLQQCERLDMRLASCPRDPLDSISYMAMMPGHLATYLVRSSTLCPTTISQKFVSLKDVLPFVAWEEEV